MLDLKLFDEDQTLPSGENFIETYKLCLKNRGADISVIDEILKLNKLRKKLLSESEQMRSQQKKMNRVIAQMKKNKENPSKQIKDMLEISLEVKSKTKLADEVVENLQEMLSYLPNMCHDSVPLGSDERDNKIVRSWGEPKEFSFEVKDHTILGRDLGILDFDRASKVAGSRFVFLMGLGARLERSLLQFMMDVHSNEHGYKEIIPPYIVNSASLYGTGQFPKFKEDVFSLENTDYFLIPTAEVSVTNIYSQEILEEKVLPQSFVAFSPCFRSEAGSYGQDTKGLIRQHQFEKVELLKFCHPERSYEELENLTGNAEKILQKLNLTYRVSSLCTGDIGFGAAKCYDLEVWLPGQKKYREISSCSNFEDFQARRAGIRFKCAGSKPQFVHTLNGSGLAIGRTLVAILENYQNADGSISIPEVLQDYMGCKEIKA